MDTQEINLLKGVKARVQSPRFFEHFINVKVEISIYFDKKYNSMTAAKKLAILFR